MTGEKQPKPLDATRGTIRILPKDRPANRVQWDWFWNRLLEKPTEKK